MRFPHRLHGKSFVMILLMVLFGPVGDVLLGKAMKRVGPMVYWPPRAVPSLLVRTFDSPLVWLGVGSLLIFFVAYMLVLTWADYSYVQPASAVGYAVVALLGVLALGEVVSSLRWVGVLVICLGVLLVGGTPPRTTATEGD